tara:strand:+ start:1087 stop:2970 length:1884 start_codon:yes stop_codon:yes gene_type:complete
MNMKIKISIISLLIIVGCGQTIDQDSLRNTQEGMVVGMEGENNTFAWKGIPFAKPPIGELRWKAPQDASAWNGTLEAIEFKSACFQGSSMIQGDSEGKWSGNEDCLYLNVWTPQLTEDQLENNQEKLPVMMWIHGGGNTTGSAHVYDPSLLVSKHNVVVVTIHYRMGPLGWFRHPALETPDSSRADISGNYGTLDTIKALEWINKNIKYFGGDPGNVTVFGESAGGHNAAAIFASPLAEGLYHKVIVQSGIMSSSSIEAAESYLPESGIAPSRSGLEAFNHILVANKSAANLIEAKKIQDEMTLEEIRTILYEQSPDVLLQSSFDARPKRGGMTRVFPDGHVILKGGIEEAFNNSSLRRVPIISGTNKDENKFFNALNRNFVKWGPATGLYKTVGVDEMPLEIIDPEYYDAISFYGSSFWKQRAVDTPARKLILSGHTDTYAYRFDWDELSTINDIDLSKLIGAAHALEILFVFGTFDSFIVKNFLFGDDAYPAGKKLSEQIQSYWAEFAYTGNPGRGREGNLPLWTSWSNQEGDKYLVLDSENDKGVFMSDIEYTQDYLLNRIASDSRLNNKEKCETLFGLSYGDGNGVSLEKFNGFMNGECADRDYSEILDMIESDDDDSDSQDN